MSEFECGKCGGLMTCKDKPCHTCEDCGGTSVGRMDGRNAKELAAEDAAFDRELEILMASCEGEEDD